MCLAPTVHVVCIRFFLDLIKIYFKTSMTSKDLREVVAHLIMQIIALSVKFRYKG